MNDDGSYSVGVCQPDAENLSPVEGGLEDALMQAKEMLQGSEAGSTDAEGGSEQSMEEAFTGGFKEVRGGM